MNWVIKSLTGAKIIQSKPPLQRFGDKITKLPSGTFCVELKHKKDYFTHKTRHTKHKGEVVIVVIVRKFYNVWIMTTSDLNRFGFVLNIWWIVGERVNSVLTLYLDLRQMQLWT